MIVESPLRTAIYAINSISRRQFTTAQGPAFGTTGVDPPAQ